MSQKYTNIIPLVRLRNDLDFFTYAIPKELDGLLAVGQLVRIPFRNRVIEGVVYSFQESFDGKTKEIKEIAEIKKMLEPWQISLIEWLSDQYFVSKAAIARMLVPAIAKRTKQNLDKFFASLSFAESLPLQPIAFSEERRLLIKYRRLKTLVAILRNAVARAKKGEQIAIIFPDYFDLQRIVEQMPEEAPGAVIYHQGMSAGRLWQNWLKVKQNEAGLIIGTRRAIFAPYANLKTIIIVDEENRSHKQEEPSPRYSVQDVALKLNKLTDAQVISLSMSPRLSSLDAVAHKESGFIELDDDRTLPQIQIVDSGQESRAGNYSPLSLPLQQAVNEALEQSKKVFLHVNRTGFMRALRCRDCETETADFSRMACIRCNSSRLKPVGLGVHHISELLKKEFPDVPVFSFDANDEYDSDTIKQYLESNQIIIATDYGLKFIPWDDVGLVGSLTTDLPWYSNEYDATEQIFTDLYRLIGMLDDQQKIIIQTRKFEHWVFETLRQYDLKSFYVQEIKDRKAFNLPPFATALTLIYKNPQERAGENELKSIHHFIKQQLPPEVSLGDPRPAPHFLVRENFIWHIPLVIPKGYDPAKLNFIKKLPVLVDIET